MLQSLIDCRLLSDFQGDMRVTLIHEDSTCVCEKILIYFPIIENNNLPLFCGLQASRSFMTLIHGLSADHLV